MYISWNRRSFQRLKNQYKILQHHHIYININFIFTILQIKDFNNVTLYNSLYLTIKSTRAINSHIWYEKLNWSDTVKGRDVWRTITNNKIVSFVTKQARRGFDIELYKSSAMFFFRYECVNLSLLWWMVWNVYLMDVSIYIFFFVKLQCVISCE